MGRRERGVGGAVGEGGGDKERKSLCGDAEDGPHVNLNPCREQRR